MCTLNQEFSAFTTKSAQCTPLNYHPQSAVNTYNSYLLTQPQEELINRGSLSPIPICTGNFLLNTGTPILCTGILAASSLPLCRSCPALVQVLPRRIFTLCAPTITCQQRLSNKDQQELDGVAPLTPDPPQTSSTTIKVAESSGKVAGKQQTRRGNHVNRRPFTTEAPPIVTIHPFREIAVALEPVMR